MPTSKQCPAAAISFQEPVPNEQGLADWKRLVLSQSLRHYILRALSVQIVVAHRGMRAAYGIYGMLLLSGPPGTGKTTIARALVSAVLEKIPSIKRALLIGINCHAIFSAEFGGSQKNVQALFAKIRELAATGIFLFLVIDEADSVLADRQSVDSPANPHDLKSSVNAVIEGVDSIAKEFRNVFIIATTNHPQSIDPAILDRFDVHIELGLPEGRERLLIVAQTLKAFQPANCLASKLSRAAGCLVKKAQVGRASIENDCTVFAECQPLLKATEGLSPRQLSRLPIHSVIVRDAAIDSHIALSDLVLGAQKMRRQK